MLTFQWLLSQIGGVGSLQGSSGTMKRILTQVDNAGGEMSLDGVTATLAEVQSFLGDAYEASASSKLIIIGGDSGNDPTSEQSILIQYVG
jgi:phosphopentomutase